MNFDRGVLMKYFIAIFFAWNIALGVQNWGEYIATFNLSSAAFLLAWLLIEIGDDIVNAIKSRK